MSSRVMSHPKGTRWWVVSCRRGLKSPAESLRDSHSPLTTHHSPLPRSGWPRSGLTLIELLIVMTIMLAITAAAIPTMINGAQGRRLREAARLTSSFVSGARNRATETGRPYGVVFERFGGDTDFSMNLSYMEMPEPYAGDFEASQAMLKDAGSGVIQIKKLGINLDASDESQGTWDEWASANLRVGDLIKFNFQNRLYALFDASKLIKDQTVGTSLPNAPWQLLAADLTSAMPVLPDHPSGGKYLICPYQIFRQPLKTSASPLQLPQGMVVDLSQSGMGQSGLFNSYSATNSYANPMIMFFPGGAVQYVYDGSTISHPTGPIHLLVGRRDGMSDVNTGTDLKNPPNLFDLTNFWVSIGYQTGMVSTIENAKITSGTPAIQLQEARALAQTHQSMGAK